MADTMAQVAAEIDAMAGDADMVNYPPHYAEGWSNGAELLDITENLNFNRGNAVKYIARAGRKDAGKELEDLEKAEFYLKREIARVRTAQPPKKPDPVLASLNMNIYAPGPSWIELMRQAEADNPFGYLWKHPKAFA